MLAQCLGAIFAAGGKSEARRGRGQFATPYLSAICTDIVVLHKLDLPFRYKGANFFNNHNSVL